MPKVTTIPATKNKFTALPTASIAKRRTAAYAREDWKFVKIYTDDGISALNTKHRSVFNEMVKDALDGKIDLIVTKSVSRFARNTVDGLVTIRKLKEKGGLAVHQPLGVRHEILQGIPHHRRKQAPHRHCHRPEPAGQG